MNWNLISDSDSKIKFVSLNILHGKLMADRFNPETKKLTSEEYIKQLMDQIESMIDDDKLKTETVYVRLEE